MDSPVEEPPQERLAHWTHCKRKDRRRRKSRANPHNQTIPPRPCTEEERERVLSCVPMAQGMCKGYGREDNLGSEALSVAFLALTRAAQDYNPELGFTFVTYAYACISGKLKQAFHEKRHLRGYLHRPEGLMLHSLTLTVDECKGGNSQVTDHRRGRDLPSEEEAQWLLKHARPDERELLHLHFWEGKTKAEIAKLQGLTKQRIDQKIHRVLRRFKNLLIGNQRKENPNDPASNLAPGDADYNRIKRIKYAARLREVATSLEQRGE